MNRRPLVNVAQSVHQRQPTRAKKEERPFNELLQHYAIERFVYRLGRSSHTDKLLLKGALLRVWQIPRARPTMDNRPRRARSVLFRDSSRHAAVMTLGEHDAGEYQGRANPVIRLQGLAQQHKGQ